MAWTKSVTLWCDGEDCATWTAPGEDTVSRTRKAADDWKYRDGKDYCPECQ